MVGDRNYAVVPTQRQAAYLEGISAEESSEYGDSLEFDAGSPVEGGFRSNGEQIGVTCSSQLAEARLENADGGDGGRFSSQDLLTKGNGYGFYLLGHLDFIFVPASFWSNQDQ